MCRKRVENVSSSFRLMKKAIKRERIQFLANNGTVDYKHNDISNIYDANWNFSLHTHTHTESFHRCCMSSALQI